MKAHALYHLLQLRARKFNETLSNNSETTLKEIQKSIKIKRIPGGYTLNWTVNQMDFSLTPESDPFKFYEKGDNAKHNLKRGENLNFRTHNWDAALTLWKNIFATSKLDPELIHDDGKLAFGDFQEKTNQKYNYEGIVIALALSLFSAVQFSFHEAVQVFFLIIALLLFSTSFSYVQIRKPMQLGEKIIISLGGLIPLYYDIELSGIIFNLIALYLITLAEKKTERRLFYYAFSGICFALAGYITPVFTTATVSILALLIVIISLIDGVRIKKIEATLFIISTVLSFYLLYFFASNGYLPTYSYPEILNLSVSTAILFGVFLFLFAACFSLWWITGVQYYLLPWLSLLSLPLAMAYTFYAGHIPELLMIGAMSGFLLVILYRVLRSLLFQQKTR